MGGLSCLRKNETVLYLPFKGVPLEGVVQRAAATMDHKSPNKNLMVSLILGSHAALRYYFWHQTILEQLRTSSQHPKHIIQK